MKKFISFLSLFLCFVLIGNISMGSVIADKIDVENIDVIYITNKNNDLIKFSKNIEIVNIDIDNGKINVDFLTKKVICIEGDLINSFKSHLLQRYNHGLRTIILNDLEQKNSIKDFFEVERAPEKIRDIILSENESEDLIGVQLGFVAYKHNEYDIIAHINVVDMKEDVSFALKNAIEYDYSRLFTSSIDVTSTNSWSIIGSDVGSNSGQGITLNASIQIFLDSNSPDAQGYGYFHSKLVQEARSYSGTKNVGLCRTTLFGPLQNQILDYGPPNQTVSGGGSVNFTLSFGVGSISYTPVSAVRIDRDFGGIGSRGVSINHQPRFGWFNTTVEFMRSRIDYVSRREGTDFWEDAVAVARGTQHTSIAVKLKYNI